jgi:hypothetical protein
VKSVRVGGFEKLMKQKRRKIACEIFHDKADFAALTPAGLLVGGDFYGRN